MKGIWKSKDERQRLKRLREIERQIKDEQAHIMGHKARIDALKDERDMLLR